MKEIPSWSDLGRSYKNQTIDYLSNSKRELSTSLFLGIGAAIFSIGLTILTLPGSIMTYYLISIFVGAILMPNSNDGDHKFSIAFPWKVSTLMISIFTGFYIIAGFEGALESYTISLLSLLIISFLMILFMIIYALILSLSGVILNDAYKKLKQNSNKKCDQTENIDDRNEELEKSRSYN